MANESCIELQLENLTDEMLIEVLIRLPWQSTRRFMCVSKRWMSLISNPYFVDRFRHHNNNGKVNNNNNLLVLVTGTRKEMYGEKFITKIQKVFPSSKSTLKDSIPISFDFLHKKVGVFNLLSVSKDLYLIHDTKLNLLVCNPSTKQLSLELPRRWHFDEIASFIGILCSEDDPSIYKVVIGRFDDIENIQIKFDIFSSDSGCWSTFVVPVPSNYNRVTFTRSNQPAVICNGKLHWAYSTLSVVVYDPFDKPDQCDFIKFPEEFDDEDDFILFCDNFRLSNVQGCIRIYNKRVYDRDPIAILTFWEYNNNAWNVKKFNLSSVDLGSMAAVSSCYRKYSMKIKGFDPFNGDIVYAHALTSGQFLAIDMKALTAHTIDDLSLSSPFPLIMNLFPYSQLPWPTPI
ncbi:putative F-box protein At2g02890 [Chenopodium quinoa]|uniref:putative F-box protein At2g02890 n=1 Tax=Chenopodium quinoa TaxID=63459 RepID=UPI000B76C925|nr:putative F-box protein At2g02890 [Chenopodium quinoa]